MRLFVCFFLFCFVRVSNSFIYFYSKMSNKTKQMGIDRKCDKNKLQTSFIMKNNKKYRYQCIKSDAPADFYFMLFIGVIEDWKSIINRQTIDWKKNTKHPFWNRWKINPLSLLKLFIWIIELFSIRSDICNFFFASLMSRTILFSEHKFHTICHSS